MNDHREAISAIMRKLTMKHATAIIVGTILFSSKVTVEPNRAMTTNRLVWDRINQEKTHRERMDFA